MAARDYQAVTTLEDLSALLAEVQRDPARLVAFDVETGYSTPQPVEKRALDIYHPDFFVVGFSITTESSWARYVPLRHDSHQYFEPMEVWEKFRPVFEQQIILAHHKKFEDKVLRALHTQGDAKSQIISGLGHDSMLSAYVSGQFKESSLKHLTSVVLGEEQATFASLFAKPDGTPAKPAEVKRARFNSLNPTVPSVISYACDDAALCLDLHNVLYPQLSEDQRRIYDLEMGISSLMVEAEGFGVGVAWEDMVVAKKHGASFRPLYDTTVREHLGSMSTDPRIKEKAKTVNFGSALQMRSLLYEDIGLTTTRTTPKGELSTDAQALEALSRRHVGIRGLLAYRETSNLAKRLDKWLDEYSGARDGRVHASFAQTRVVSGRFSANDPALQQLGKDWLWSNEVDEEFKPIKSGVNGVDHWAGNFREFIAAGPERYLLTFDYSQVELRVLAGVTQDQTLLTAFANGIDPHIATAAMMLGIPIEQVTSKERGIGKAQPLDAKVLTPFGWVHMGDLKVGDEVIGSQGTPVKVTGVFPQGKKPTYRVETGDGSTECCDEHLWAVRNVNTSSHNEFRTKTLRQIMDSGLRNTASVSKGKEYFQPKYQLPQRPVVQYAQQEEPLRIDPYVLGLLLGDGCFTHDAIAFASADGELLSAVEAEAIRLGCKASSRKPAGENFWTVYIWGDGSRKRGSNPLREALKHYGLDRKKSDVKFVPQEYMLADPQERLAVLQGLLDTDGAVQASGALFRVSSKMLAEQVRELAQSLGGFASIKDLGVPEYTRGDGRYRTKFPVWSVYLTLPVGVAPFRLDRKKVKQRKSEKHPTIRSVEYVGEKEMQCISVDAEDHLYVTDDFIVTHNTLNFAILYGMGPKSMAERLAITLDEAKGLVDQYKSQFQSISAWDSAQRSRGIQQKYVTTWLGRTVPLFQAWSDKQGLVAQAERLAVNAPIQGGAADYVKLAMLRSKMLLMQAGLWGPDKVMLTMNQHDSLTFEAHESIDPNYLRSILDNAVVFDAQAMFPGKAIPKFPDFEVDWEIGLTWGGSKGWEDEKLAWDDAGVQWRFPEADPFVRPNTSALAIAEPEQVVLTLEGLDDTPAPVEESLPLLPPEGTVVEFTDSGVEEWHPTEEEKILQITASSEISMAQIAKLGDLLRSAPGDTTVCVTDKVLGWSQKLDVKTCLTVDDADRIRLALPSATIS